MILSYYPKNSDIKPLYISFNNLKYFGITNDIKLHFIQHFTKSTGFIFVYFNDKLINSLGFLRSK
jgi:hypothetical protein